MARVPDGAATDYEAMIMDNCGVQLEADARYVVWLAQLLGTLEQRGPRIFASTAVSIFACIAAHDGSSIAAFHARCVAGGLTVERILAGGLHDTLAPGRSETFASICAAEEQAIGADLQRRIAEVAALPDTDIACPKCRRCKAITSFAQTRSNDEPLTEYGDCPFPDCQFHWRA